MAAVSDPGYKSADQLTISLRLFKNWYATYLKAIEMSTGTKSYASPERATSTDT